MTSRNTVDRVLVLGQLLCEPDEPFLDPGLIADVTPCLEGTLTTTPPAVLRRPPGPALPANARPQCAQRCAAPEASLRGSSPTATLSSCSPTPPSITSQ